jgi:hypothetical protein
LGYISGGGDFKLGNQITPSEYFYKGINLIRDVVGENLPVTIFTDADEQELTGLLNLPNVQIAENKPDMLDIILLSRSKIMLLSRSSTFGYWAAFLSDAIVVRPFDDWQPIIKNDDCRYKEIKWNYKDEKSTHEFKKILGNERCYF